MAPAGFTPDVLLALLAALVAAAGLCWVSRHRAGHHHDGGQALQRIILIKCTVAELPDIRALLGAAVANMLLARLSETVMAAAPLTTPPRITADTIIFVAAGSDDADIRALADQITTIIACPTHVAGLTFHCTANAQVATGRNPGWCQSDADLLGDADDVHHFTDLDHSAIETAGERVTLLRDLAHAAAHDGLSLAYQPKIDLRQQNIPSLEALLRWERGNDDPVNIGDLVDLLEKTALIKDVTLWTIKRAIRDGELLLSEAITARIFINISGSLLSDNALIDTLIALARQSDAKIGIEITETAIIIDPRSAIRNLHRIAAADIDIAIDDFGVGVSSLEYLQQLPATELKIDQTFIAELSSSHRNPLIVKATIDLAHALEMKVTAEGVDDQLSLALLAVMGCDMGQGFIISRPLPVTDLLVFLKQHGRDAAIGLSDQPPAMPTPRPQVTKN